MRGLILTVAMISALSGTAAAGDEQPICADRPSKSSGACTVPKGQWQVETGLIDWSRSKSNGVSADTTAWGNTAIKYGIGSRTDIELWVTPLETLRVHGGGVHDRQSSFGDIVMRVKYALTRDGAPVQVALDPFVKIPTANHQLGNGKVEGGLVVPFQIPIAKSPLTLSLDPELDLHVDGDRRGRHLAAEQVVNLGIQASEKVSLSTEIWAMWDWDPDGTGKQVSWDVAAAYLPTRKLQLDAGANFGLNKQTPNLEVYTGVSMRF